MTSTVRACIDPRFPDYPWKVLANYKLVIRALNVKGMPIKHFLSINHALVNEYSDVSFPQIVPLVAYRHELPQVSGLSEGMADIYNGIVQVNSQKGIRNGEAQPVVILIKQTEDL